MLLTSIAIVVAFATTAFAQSPSKNEIRTYVSGDGQRLQVNSRGQIVGFEQGRGCDGPKCSTIGIGLWGWQSEGGKLFRTNGRFAPDAPPNGTKVGADGEDIDVELDVQGVPGLVVRIKWRPLSQTAGIEVIAGRLMRNLLVEAAEPPKGQGSKSPAAALIPLGIALGCECDVPTGYVPPFDIRSSFGKAVSERVPSGGFRAEPFPFLRLSDIRWVTRPDEPVLSAWFTRKP